MAFPFSLAIPRRMREKGASTTPLFCRDLPADSNGSTAWGLICDSRSPLDFHNLEVILRPRIDYLSIHPAHDRRRSFGLDVQDTRPPIAKARATFEIIVTQSRVWEWHTASLFGH